MIDPLSAAEYFIVRAYEDKTDAEMTHMKLQKLLYYAQSLHLALYDETLFAEEIQAWRYGPVCPSAYEYYCNYTSNQLPIPTGETLSGTPADVKKLLEEVWSNFGIHSAYSLRDMTHEELPWKIARAGLPREARSQEPLSLVEMKKLGESKLVEIEETHPAYEPVMEKVLASALSAKPDRSNYIEKEDVRGWLESLLD